MPRKPNRPVAEILLVLGAIPLVFPGLFHPDRIPVARDLLVFFIPAKAYLGASLRALDLPLWNPFLHLGEPFLGTLQSGVFYPPSLWLAVPFPVGLNLFVLFHYAVAAAGLWALGRDRGLSPVACATGAVVYALGGYLVSLLNLLNHLQGAAWAPWVVLAWTAYLRRSSGRRLAGLVAVMAVQFLAGSLEHWLLTLVVCAVLGTDAVLRNPSRALSATTGLAGAVVLALGLTAFQLLPFLELVGESARAGPISPKQVFFWALDPRNVLGLVLPNGETGGSGLVETLFVGPVVLGLALAGSGGCRDRIAWSALVVVGVLLALGERGFVLPATYERLPDLVGRFRYPEKFLFLLHLPLAVLAAEGAERLDRNGRFSTLVVGTTLAGTVALAIATGVPEAAGTRLRLGIVIVSAGILLWARGRAWIDARALALGLLAIVVVDLGMLDRSVTRTASWQWLRSQPPMLDADPLREERTRFFHYKGRPPGVSSGTAEAGLELVPLGSLSLPERDVALWSALFGNVGMVYGVRSLGGASGATPAWTDALLRVLPDLSRDGAFRLLASFSVARLVGPEPKPSPLVERVEPVRPSPFVVYRLREFLPLAYLASSVRTAATPGEALERMADESFRPGRDVVLGERPSGWEASGTVDGTVRIRSFGAERLRLETKGDGPAILVLNEPFYPGWKARVDGRPVPILRANGIVRAVVLGEGRHEVEFFYRPGSFRLGLAVSAAAALVLLVMVMVRRSPRRPS